MKSTSLAALLTLVAALPAAAQNRGVSREQFTYLDNSITIEVMTDLPGTLQVVRGEPGAVDVAGKVPDGFSTAALGGRDGDKLRLTAVGGSRADFIVVVPEEVYLRVMLPNRKVGELGSTRPGGTFSWDAKGGSARAEPTSSMAAPAPDGPLVAHSAPDAPRMLTVPRLTTVRTVTVRFGSSTFDVAGNHYLSVQNGGGDNVEVRTGDDVEELVVNVPSRTRDFTLQLAGRNALVVRGGEVTAYCEPLTEQDMPGGIRWFTFAPEAGHLSCR